MCCEQRCSQNESAVQNGGSARGYQRHHAPLTSRAKADLADGDGGLLTAA
jgi:hypothetical protein